jgi:alpha-aminoadipic semialdehyde synthase
LGVQVGTLLPDRSYAFFSHTHKAQPENMPLLDEVLNKRVRLFDYELIVNDQGSRLVAFGEFAGRAGMVDFLRGLGEKYLSLGYSTPFLSLGSSYMYPSLAAAKAAVLAVGEEIASVGLPAAICPITFVFTGTGNGKQDLWGAQPSQAAAGAIPPVAAAAVPRLSSCMVTISEQGICYVSVHVSSSGWRS